MLPKIVQSQPSAIASYDYMDLAQNTGIKLFYVAAEANSGGTEYFLTGEQVYSSSIEVTGGATASSNFIKMIDISADLSAFNAPAILRGTAVFVLCIDNVRVGGTDEFSYVVINVQKWDGTTATTIGTVTSETISGATDYKILCVRADITKTSFKKGENLRINIEGWTKVTGGGTNTLTMGIDPMNRDGTAIIPSTDSPASTTQIKCWIPFDLDIK
jgi:hypothetical protein